mmetsp:Transcript_8562/g.15118  ORF Transcript_8562/g.15118 Transcript_8562/m.15118 type:complete len:85 (+) Transcript_8562:1381-1635(+)
MIAAILKAVTSLTLLGVLMVDSCNTWAMVIGSKSDYYLRGLRNKGKQSHITISPKDAFSIEGGPGPSNLVEFQSWSLLYLWNLL